MEIAQTCRKCSAPLLERSGTGRRPVYCSTGCRRAAEYEIRRLQAAIEKVEGNIRWHRESLALELSDIGLACCGGPDGQRKHLGILEGQRSELDDRFTRLLDD